MRIVLDSNLMLRSVQPAHPSHTTARQATSALLARGDELCLVPQNFYEFWVVATRPVAQNGLGLSAASVVAELARFRALFTLLPDVPAILPEWERLVSTHAVIGKQAHDARFVAAMSVHGVDHILTFNVGDFARYPGITVLDPATVAGH
jgi:predicted nucleic acid-binding protein